MAQLIALSSAHPKTPSYFRISQSPTRLKHVTPQHSSSQVIVTLHRKQARYRRGPCKVTAVVGGRMTLGCRGQGEPSSVRALSFGEEFVNKAFDTRPSARTDATFSEIQRSATSSSNYASVTHHLTEGFRQKKTDRVYVMLKRCPRSKHTRGEARFATSIKRAGGSSFGETFSTDVFIQHPAC